MAGPETMMGLVSDPFGGPFGGPRMRSTRLSLDTGGACDQARFQIPDVAWNDEPGRFEWIFGQVNDRRAD